MFVESFGAHYPLTSFQKERNMDWFPERGKCGEKSEMVSRK